MLQCKKFIDFIILKCQPSIFFFRRTARATLYCAPLFASHFFFVMFRPTTDSCPWEQVYYFFVYFIEGLQGILVVLLYFYKDREVVRVLQLSYNRLAFAVTHRFSINQNTTVTSFSAVDDRKRSQGKLQCRFDWVNINKMLNRSHLVIIARPFQTPDVILTSDPGNFSRSTYEPDLQITTKIDDWDPNVTGTNVSLVSIDFGEDDLDDFYVNDESVVYDKNNVHEAICELAENGYLENKPDELNNKVEDIEKKPEAAIATTDSGKLADLHPKLFFKDRSTGIVFVNDEEKL
jgi:hypothetical protein